MQLPIVAELSHDARLLALTRDSARGGRRPVSRDTLRQVGGRELARHLAPGHSAAATLGRRIGPAGDPGPRRLA